MNDVSWKSMRNNRSAVIARVCAPAAQASAGTDIAAGADASRRTLVAGMPAR